MNLKQWFLIKSGYYIVPCPSTALNKAQGILICGPFLIITLTFPGCQNRAKTSTYRPCSTPFKWDMTSVYDQIMAVRQTFQSYPTSDPLSN